jgi:GAF domain-containing protein
VPDRAASLAELSSRLGRASDLDTLVGSTVDGVAQVLGYEHVSLLLLDESGTRLFTIASHGYPDQGVGSEVAVGEGIVGLAAANAAPVRVNNVRHLEMYAESVARAYAGVGPGHEIPLPDFPEAQSRLAVPAMALGELVGVLVVESDRVVAFDDADDLLLTVVATLAANAIEAERAGQADAGDDQTGAAGDAAERVEAASTRVRFFASDGSLFLDDDYLIKGVAGRILWSLLGHFEREGRTEFTNKEVRLDPSLELPEFRDNLESRLMLKRRLDEQSPTIRIEKTGRGRFRLVVDGPVTLDAQ